MWTMWGNCDLFGTKCEWFKPTNVTFLIANVNKFGPVNVTCLVPNGNPWLFGNEWFHGAGCALRTIMVSTHCQVGMLKQNATPKRKSPHNPMVIGNTNTSSISEWVAAPNSKSCRFLKDTSAIVSKIGHDLISPRNRSWFIKNISFENRSWFNVQICSSHLVALVYIWWHNTYSGLYLL